MRELATRLNSSASRINDLEKGRTKLNVDWIHRLAKVFEVSPSRIAELTLGEAKEMIDDVEEYDGDLPDLRLTTTQRAYLVKSIALDQIGILPEMLLIAETSPALMSTISSGDIAIVNFHEDTGKRVLLRQFVPPSILVSNSSGDNAPVVNLRTHDAGITGVVVSSFQRYREKFKSVPNG